MTLSVKDNPTIRKLNIFLSRHFIVLTLVLLGFLIYSNILTHSCFQDDDRPTIVNNPDIRDLKNIGLIFHSFHTRFVVGLSFAFNYWLNGINSWGYHLFNVICHILSSLFVCHIILLLFQTPKLQGHPLKRFDHYLAPCIAILFLVHPVQAESVNFLTQRFSSLAGFFYLASIDFYLQGRLKNSWWFIVGSLLTTLSAMFCKEHTVTLPIMLLMIEVYFWEAQFCRKRWLVLSPFLLTMAVIPIMLLNTPVDTTSTTRIANMSIQFDPETKEVLEKKIDITRANLGMDRKEYFLSQFNVFWTYLRLLIFPVNQNLDYDYPITKTFLNLPFILSALGIFLILIYGIKAFLTDRLLSFGILWFFLVLLPESSVIPIGYLIGEHRLYLAIIGFGIVGTVLLLKLTRNPHKFLLLVIIITFIFSIATYRRNIIWTNELSLWSDVIQKAPRKARAYNNRGNIWARMQRPQDAIQDFNKALALVEEYEKINPTPLKGAVNLMPEKWKILGNRANVYQQIKDYERALNDYDQAIQLNPRYDLAYVNRGVTYSLIKQNDKALVDYTEAIRINPKNFAIYNNRGNIYFMNGQYRKALDDYNMSLTLNPHNSEAYLNRANIKSMIGNFRGAWNDVQKAQSLGTKVPLDTLEYFRQNAQNQ